MYIEESYQSCSNNNMRWTPRLIYGWYMYDKIGKKIPIVGHVCYADACESYLKIFVPEDPVNYSFDENCNLSGAKEVFEQKIGSDILEWQSKGGPKYPVQLTTAHAIDFSTKASLILKINGIDVGNYDLNKLAKNDYIETIELLTYKRDDNKFHLIFKYAHQSNPGSYGYGMCGAGSEEFIGHLTINSQLEVDSFYSIQTHSCIESYEVEVMYDVNQPELGVKRKN